MDWNAMVVGIHFNAPNPCLGPSLCPDVIKARVCLAELPSLPPLQTLVSLARVYNSSAFYLYILLVLIF